MPSGRDGCGPPGSDPPSESDGSVSPGALSRIGIAAGFPRRFGSFPPAACGRDRRTPFRDPSGAGDRSAPGTQFGLRSRCEPGPDSRVGITGHKGRVMNMRWGRFGSINICLLIDWCNEPTKKFRLARAACLLVGSARRESRPAVARSGLRGRSFRSCRVGIQNFYVAV